MCFKENHKQDIVVAATGIVELAYAPQVEVGGASFLSGEDSARRRSLDAVVSHFGIEYVIAFFSHHGNLVKEMKSVGSRCDHILNILEGGYNPSPRYSEAQMAETRGIVKDKVFKEAKRVFGKAYSAGHPEA